MPSSTEPRREPRAPDPRAGKGASHASGSTSLAFLAGDVVEHLPSAVLVAGADGRVLFANPAAHRLLGPFDEGEPILDQIAGSDELREAIGSALASQSGAPLAEIAVESPELGQVPVEMRATPLRDERGAVYAILFLLENVAAARRRAGEIRRLENLASLGRFASAVAHEIRNPLTGIGAGVQYLMKFTATNPEEIEMGKLILGEIDRLNRIVEDIFHAGRPLRISRRPLDIRGPIERAVALVGDLAARQRVTLEMSLDASLPEITVDGERIEQVVINLLRNAVQCSPPEGRVVVRTRLAVASPRDRLVPVDGPPHLAIEVVDQGAGIASEKLQQIFEPFFTSRVGGTGLGLYVSHMIVDAHGGSIRVESEVGLGSTFTVLLPFARA
jgi:signal transduction histidine kinase